MSIMLGDNAVSNVVKRLNENGLPAFEGRAYKYEKREKVTGEYIAVNHLPFTHDGEVETGTVNINIHVPRLKTNEPDTQRLNELAESVVALFPRGTFIEGAYYEFAVDSRPVFDNDGTYFTNLEINVTYNDLNY